MTRFDLEKAGKAVRREQRRLELLRGEAIKSNAAFYLFYLEASPEEVQRVRRIREEQGIKPISISDDLDIRGEQFRVVVRRVKVLLDNEETKITPKTTRKWWQFWKRQE